MNAENVKFCEMLIATGRFK